MAMTRTRPAQGQLPLPLDDAVEPEGLARVDRWTSPMTPGDTEAPFDDPAWFFEPWWPGALATIIVTGGGMRLLAGQLVDPLVAFPELAVTGYPPEDLLLRPAFVAEANEVVAKIAARTGATAAVIDGATTCR